MEITQEELNDIVLSIADHQVRLANLMSILRRQGDPDAWRREKENMMLFNILDSLKNYDLTYDIFTDTEIKYLLELATILTEN